MKNFEILFSYLVGNREHNKEDDKAYLLSDRSINKVTMISGDWGSGKTYFWNDVISTKLANKYNNIYISLYGKDSIKAIETELFLKAYSISLGRDSIDDKDMIEKIYSTFSNMTKSASGFFGINSNIFEEENLKTKFNKANDVINDGLIICFDDFERKSSKIDLNDLFGFISNLSIQFSCKIVIILNSDSFKNEDKVIFSRVREKTVHKYLTYKPSYEYLFSQIVCDNEYIKNEIFKNTLELISQTKLLNARVYEQVVNNLTEYILVKKEISPGLLKCLVLNTIFFNLHHKTINVYKFQPIEGRKLPLRKYGRNGEISLDTAYIRNFRHIPNGIANIIPLGDFTNMKSFKESLANYFYTVSEEKLRTKNQEYIKFINDNVDELYNTALYIYKFNIYDKNYMSIYDEIKEIIEFIQNGILIYE